MGPPLLRLSQREAAAEAGISKDREVPALRVANVPADTYEAAIERPDPATANYMGSERHAV